MNGRRDNRKPGDLILDRYMPNATPEEREKAREALREVMAYLYGLASHLPKPPSKRDSRKEKESR